LYYLVFEISGGARNRNEYSEFLQQYVKTYLIFISAQKKSFWAGYICFAAEKSDSSKPGIGHLS
jgi:hypothetical protein